MHPLSEFRRPGEPYTAFPAAEDGTFKAVFVTPKGGMDFCTCDPSGKSIKASKCVDVSEWWDNGDPPTVCADGTVFIAPQSQAAGKTQPVYRVDGVTGALMHVIDIVGHGEDYDVETMACVV